MHLAFLGYLETSATRVGRLVWFGHQHDPWHSGGGESAVMHCIGALEDCQQTILALSQADHCNVSSPAALLQQQTLGRHQRQHLIHVQCEYTKGPACFLPLDMTQILSDSQGPLNFGLVACAGRRLRRLPPASAAAGCGGPQPAPASGGAHQQCRRAPCRAQGRQLVKRVAELPVGCKGYQSRNSLLQLNASVQGLSELCKLVCWVSDSTSWLFETSSESGPQQSTTWPHLGLQLCRGSILAQHFPALPAGTARRSSHPARPAVKGLGQAAAE